MHALFSPLMSFLEDAVTPISNELDSHPNLLKNCYQAWIELGGLRLLMPAEFGGLDLTRHEWIHYTSLMAEYSGVLLFLQAQHQYAVSRLKKFLPEIKIASILQSMTKKNKGVGIAFSANKKIVTAIKNPNGFNVSGILKWVTGFSYFNNILFSFDCDGLEYYCFLPFKTVDNNLLLSPVLQPIVFSAANTVTITLQNYFISAEDIIISSPSQPKAPFEHPSIYSLLGAAKALLKIASTARYHENRYAKNMLDQLSKEWEAHHSEVMQPTLEPFQLRATGLKLTEKCLSFAKVVCGSQGLLPSHPITRLNREIWQYSIGGYSENQLEAYLNQK